MSGAMASPRSIAVTSVPGKPVTGIDFLAFLPEDGKSAAAAQTDEIIQYISSDLDVLLQRDTAAFWAELEANDSLRLCLDSYLRHCRRPHDSTLDGGSQEIPTLNEELLAQRVFMVLQRMVQQSGHGAPPAAQRAAILSKRHLLDVPKLLDVAALYSPSNPGPTQALLAAAFQLQPALTQQLHAMVEPLVSNLTQLQQHSEATAKTLLRTASAGPRTGTASSHGAPQAAAQLGDAARTAWDAVQYLSDTCATLAALVACYPRAAATLVSPGPGQLLACLTSIHEATLPPLQQALSQPHIAAAVLQELQGQGLSSPEAVAGKVPVLAAEMRLLLGQLLHAAFLQSDLSASAPPHDRASSHSHASTSSSNGASTSAGAASQAGKRSPSASKDAEQRGNALMASCMAMSQAQDTGSSHGQLLQALTAQLGLDVLVMAALQQGVITLDDAQLDYLLALLGSAHDRAALVDAASTAISAALQHAAGVVGDLSNSHAGNGHASSSHAAGGSSSPSGTSAAGRGAGDGAGPSRVAPGVEAGQLVRMVSQIKDVMGPGFGDGFLHACLHAHGYDAERVVHHLLEGSLPDHLSKLDPGLRDWAPPAAPAPTTSTAAAAGMAGLSGMGSDAAGAMSWRNLAGGAAVFAQQQAATLAARAAAVVPQPSTGPRKAQVHRGVARLLGRVDDEVKAATRALGNELQWEYDDEYDDSFDDGADLSGVDAGAECEVDALANRRRRGPGGSSGPSLMAATGPGTGPAASAGFADGYDDEPADDCAARPPSSSGPHAAAPSQAGKQAPRFVGGQGSQQQGGVQPSRPGTAAGASGAGRPGLAAEASRQVAPRAPLATTGPGQAFRAPLTTGAGASQDVRGPQGSASRPSSAAPYMQPGGSAGTSSSTAAQGGARPAADDRSAGGSGGRASGAGRGGPGGRGGRGQAGKQWVLDGRIYNYAKEGAVEVASHDAALAAVEAAKAAAQEIYGLGPGGNKGTRAPTRWQPPDDMDDGQEGDAAGGSGGANGHAGGQGGRGGRGRGGGPDGGAGGRGPPNYDRKEQNKAAVGNHHRKDRALRKMGM